MISVAVRGKPWLAIRVAPFRAIPSANSTTQGSSGQISLGALPTRSLDATNTWSFNTASILARKVNYRYDR